MSALQIDDEYLDCAVRAARQAQEIHDAGDTGDIEYKRGNSDFVTQVDKDSEKRIRSVISERYPDHNIVGEEYGGDSYNEDNVWVIDPVDGTTNFHHGFPAYGCIIAFIRNGEPYVGVFLDSANDELYYAVKGKGAYRGQEQMQVSDTPLDESLVGFAMKDTTIEDGYHQIHDWLIEETHGTRKTRSGVYSDMHVSQGHLGGRIEWFTHPWDIAASIVIVREAGGKVTDTTGDGSWEALSSDPVHIVISNGVIHDSLVERAVSSELE